MLLQWLRIRYTMHPKRRFATWEDHPMNFVQLIASLHPRMTCSPIFLV